MTEKEIAVLQLFIDGLANCQIAGMQFVSEGIVKNYVSSIYSKISVQTHPAAMKKAYFERLLQSSP